MCQAWAGGGGQHGPDSLPGAHLETVLRLVKVILSVFDESNDLHGFECFLMVLMKLNDLYEFSGFRISRIKVGSNQS